MSLEEIRGAVAQTHDRLRSLRVALLAFQPGEPRSGKHLEVVVAAKGESRYESLVHVLPGQSADPGAYVNLYDGTSFNTYYPYKHRYEISRLAATPRYTWKVREHAFFECLGWWPPEDHSRPPKPQDRALFLKDVLADSECRVRPRLENVDGRWCHIVEIPGFEVLWIDGKRGTLLKRNRFSEGDRTRPVASYHLMDYQEVAFGIWLPYTIRRKLERSGRENIYQVDEYEVNNVADHLFRFTPGPGTLVYDRDTDTFRQVPGGGDVLEETVERVIHISTAQPRPRESAGSFSMRISASLLFGAAVSAFVSRFFAGRRRRDRKGGSATMAVEPPVGKGRSVGTAAPRSKRSSVWSLVVAGMLSIHAGLLGWGAWRHSPTLDEVGHLPAGIVHWKEGRFQLYRVNPPLVRMVAALPVLCAGPRIDWDHRWRDLGSARGRRAFQFGYQFVEANGRRSLWLFTLARWACIPFSLLGGYVCFRWATRLYGRSAGVLALGLWCFSPNIIAHGQMITPDLAATALGVAACYVFWRWLQRPTWPVALAAGMMLGLVELSKMSWIILFGLWPLLWLVWLFSGRDHRRARSAFAQLLQLGLVLLLGLYVLNLGYAMEDSFRSLGNFRFCSHTLAGSPANDPSHIGPLRGNRFANRWLGALPVPVPAEYLLGIDQQQRDFEEKMWSYLRGQWRKGGWWYYYLYALLIKVPLGTWTLILLAMIVGNFRPGYTAAWRDELVLLAPLVGLLTLVSSQTGFNHHLRYVLPIFPFAFIWTSKVARTVALHDWWIPSFAAGALLWSVTSSLWCYPHSLSYFNELVSGPKHGHEHLLDSNIDWGQDMLYLKRWLDKHPKARPLGFAHCVPTVDPRIAGIESSLPPVGPDYEHGIRRNSHELGPKPGWYALSIREIRDWHNKYTYFLRFRPVAMVGYSIYIYHITPDEANRVRREGGLPEFPEHWQASAGGTGDEPAR